MTAIKTYFLHLFVYSKQYKILFIWKSKSKQQFSSFIPLFLKKKTLLKVLNTTNNFNLKKKFNFIADLLNWNRKWICAQNLKTNAFPFNKRKIFF